MNILQKSRVVLFGPPGSGKGTQGKELSKFLAINHISSGDLFRTHLGRGTALGIKAKEYMSEGLLVPDEITVMMVLEEILSPVNHQGFIMDGFPRNLTQAESLDSNLSQRGSQIDVVVSISVPQDELIRRLSNRWTCRDCQSPSQAPTSSDTTNTCSSCGGTLYQREDDKPDAVATRIQIYQSETEPLINYYAAQGIIEKVSGVGSEVEVNKRILEALKHYGLSRSHV